MRFVPSIRLLWCLGIVCVLAAAGGPLREFALLWPAAAGTLFVVALGDLVLSRQRKPSLHFSVSPVQRFTKDRPGRLLLRLFNPGAEQRSLRLGLGLPNGIDTEEPDRLVKLSAGMEHAEIAWPCIPTRRGRLQGLVLCAEEASWLGLWGLRTRETLPCELRIYPNLFSERRTLAALFLPRSQLGQRLRTMVGRGRDFEKLREYQNGDPYDEIHWKATAKRRLPVTKVFQTERTQEVYVVIDASRLSARAVTHGGRTVTSLERSLTAGLLLLLAASRQADRFGLVVFDNQVRTFIRAAQGARHYAACRDALHATQPSECSPDLGELVRQLRATLNRRALLVFLTDLSDPVVAEEACRHLGLLSRQHLVFVNQLRSPGVAPLFQGAEAGELVELQGRLAGHFRWAEARAVIQRLRPLGVHAQVLENETLAEDLINQYLSAKQGGRL